MKKMISVDEVMASLPTRRRAAIEARGKAHVARIRKRMSLAELRKDRDVSQVSIAQSLGIGQMQISRLERRTDPRISTIEKTIQAMGGKLTLLATFPNQEPVEIQIPKNARR
jgi:DNA-binding phage protein